MFSCLWLFVLLFCCSTAEAAPVSAASVASVAASPVSAAAVYSFKELHQEQRQKEAEQEQQLQRQLLRQNPELLAVYEALVGPLEGPAGDSDGSQSGLSPAEFWRLHRQQLEALKAQPVRKFYT